MVELVYFTFQHCLVPLTMLLVEGSSETGLFRHFITTFFGVRNFGNTLAMRVIFVPKCSKFNLDFKNAEANM